MATSMVATTARRLGVLRAASYCRTSGEGQRDNTSIPTQKETNEKFIKHKGWRFVRHYVDECKSGSKIAGRDAFQQMMRDAANGQFDIIVPADITRYSRDGFDIIESARTLARDFSVHVVDAKGTFDTRDHKRTVTNFVMAGVAEGDRLGILDRTIKGRIKNAEKGVPWYGKQGAPVGREYDPKLGRHVINDKGRAILDILNRFAKGESLTPLCKEHGFFRQKIYYWVANSQLAGDYYATFNQPEIGIVNDKVKVPGMPEIVTPALLAKVKRRLRFNRTHNRTDAKQYLLTGFLHCGCCKRAMSGKYDKKYDRIFYRHHGESHEYADCDFYSVRGDQVEAQILDFLYFHFLDEAAFNEAVERAMPSADTRKALVNRRSLAAKRLKRIEGEVKNVIAALKAGGKIKRLLAELDRLESRRKKLKTLIRKLDARLEALPDEDEIRSGAEVVRLMLFEEYRQRDWRELPTEEIKRFLLNLFGDSDDKTGIFIRHDDQGRLIAEFKGRLMPGLRDYRELDTAFVLKKS